MTCTVMSSPSMIFWPARRVMMSMGVPPGMPGDGWQGGLGRLLGCGRREERRADRCTLGLVDDLVTATPGDQDRSAQVHREVLEGLGRTDGHVHVGVGGI